MNPAAELATWFPDVKIWFGPCTGSWWAFVPGRPDRLVEAPNPRDLARKLATTTTGPVTAPRTRPFR